MSKVTVIVDGREFAVDVTSSLVQGDELAVVCNGQMRRVSVPDLASDNRFEWAVIDGRPYEIVVDSNLHWIKAHDGLHEIEVVDQSISFSRPASGDGRVKAPIPGLIVRVLVEPGQAVEPGQPLLVLEAMKMENEIMAPRGGVVSELNASPGQSVRLNDLLIEIA